MLLKTTLSLTAVTAALLGPTALTPREPARQDDETAAKLVAELEAIRVAQEDAAKAAEEALRRAEVERAELETNLAELAAQEAAMQEALNREKMEEDRRFAEQTRLLDELKDREAQLADRQIALKNRLVASEVEMADRRERITKLEMERAQAQDELLDLKARFDARMQDEKIKRHAERGEHAKAQALADERAAYEAMLRDLEVQLKESQRELDVASLVNVRRRVAQDALEEAKVARRMAEIAEKKAQYEAVKRYHEEQAKKTWRDTSLARPATPTAPSPNSGATPSGLSAPSVGRLLPPAGPVGSATGKGGPPPGPAAPRMGSFALPGAPAAPASPKTVNTGDGVTIIVEQGDVHVHMNGSGAPSISTHLPPASGGFLLPPAAPKAPKRPGAPAAPAGPSSPWPMPVPVDPALELPPDCEDGSVAGVLFPDVALEAVAANLYTQGMVGGIAEITAPDHAEVLTGVLLSEVANVNTASNELVATLLAEDALLATAEETTLLLPTLIAAAEQTPDTFPLAGNLVVGTELIGYVGNEAAANEAQAAIDEIHAMMEALHRDLSNLQSLVETLSAELDR